MIPRTAMSKEDRVRHDLIVAIRRKRARLILLGLVNRWRRT